MVSIEPLGYREFEIGQKSPSITYNIVGHLYKQKLSNCQGHTAFKTVKNEISVQTNKSNKFNIKLIKITA